MIKIGCVLLFVCGCLLIVEKHSDGRSMNIIILARLGGPQKCKEEYRRDRDARDQKYYDDTH
jgi:hypothetical protein